jgi:hypothetical protein
MAAVEDSSDWAAALALAGRTAAGVPTVFRQKVLATA